MPDPTPQKCPSAMCDSGPCRIASRLIVAEPAEVPPDCPNRVNAAAVSDGWLRSRMSDPSVYLTSRARQLVSPGPTGARNGEVLTNVRGGRLLLLERRVQPPFRASAILTTKQSTVEPVEPPPTPTTDKHWIEVVMVDRAGKPVANEKYWIQLPDGSVKEGKLNGQGKVKLDDIPGGTCRIRFPELKRPVNAA